MFDICHPEATYFLPPKDLSAPCESPALFGGDESARRARFLIGYGDYDHHSGGGKNNAKLDQLRAVRAVYRAFGSVPHRLLCISSQLPRSLRFTPLSTTFVHIFTRKSLIVKHKLEGWSPTWTCPWETTRPCG